MIRSSCISEKHACNEHSKPRTTFALRGDDRSAKGHWIIQRLQPLLFGFFWAPPGGVRKTRRARCHLTTSRDPSGLAIPPWRGGGLLRQLEPLALAAPCAEIDKAASVNGAAQRAKRGGATQTELRHPNSKRFVIAVHTALVVARRRAVWRQRPDDGNATKRAGLPIGCVQRQPPTSFCSPIRQDELARKDIWMLPF